MATLCSRRISNYWHLVIQTGLSGITVLLVGHWERDKVGLMVMLSRMTFGLRLGSTTARSSIERTGKWSGKQSEGAGRSLKS